MRRILSILVTLTWGLWFGGLIVLFLSVTTLFRTFNPPATTGDSGSATRLGLVTTRPISSSVAPLSSSADQDLPFDPSRGREIAGFGAARIFHLFNKYQLVLAIIALLTTFAWRVLGPPRMKEALFTVFALATVGGCWVSMYLSPHMETLQREGLTHSPQFGRLHGYSMIAYAGEVAVLLIAGIMLPWINDLRADAEEAKVP